MNLKELGSLKFFIAFIALVIGFYIYSGVIGWKWIGSAQTEKNKPNNNRSHNPRFFHK